MMPAVLLPRLCRCPHRVRSYRVNMLLCLHLTAPCTRATASFLRVYLTCTEHVRRGRVLLLDARVADLSLGAVLSSFIDNSLLSVARASRDAVSCYLL